MMHFRSMIRTLALVCVSAVLVASCGDADNDGTDESLGFVGTVEGTDAFVSLLVVSGSTGLDQALVYVCDGDAELAEWFEGPIDDPTSLALTNDAGASVTFELVDGAFRGEFTDTAGATHGFATVEATGGAGLYEVDDEVATADGVWAAWVVDNDSSERGAFRRGGTFEPTPRLSSVSYRLSRFSITNGAIGMNGIVTPNN